MIIEARYNGPPDSGNGGYSAGIIALAADPTGAAGSMEVTLRTPPPLDTPLTLTDGAVRAPDGTLVAEVRPADTVAPPVPPVPPVPPTVAEAAARRYAGFAEHPFPTCYVCGPQRAPGDGLRIFPGRLPDGRTAAPWTAPAGTSPAVVWAALDCPGGWAVIAPGRPYVLGRITAAVSRLPADGEPCVVVGAPVSAAGRKAVVNSTVYGSDGGVIGVAAATWIALPG